MLLPHSMLLIPREGAAPAGKQTINIAMATEREKGKADHGRLV